MSIGYTVAYSPQALDDLRDIHGYIADTLKAPQAAQKRVIQIMDAVRSLKTMPLCHAPAGNGRLAAAGVRRVNVGSYAVLYAVDETRAEVVIARILYGRCDLDTAPGEVL